MPPIREANHDEHRNDKENCRSVAWRPDGRDLAGTTPAGSQDGTTGGNGNTAATCETNWQNSPAAQTCGFFPTITTTTTDDGGTNCTVTANCRREIGWVNGLWQSELIEHTVIVALGDVTDLHNCDGTLTEGSC